MSPETRRRALLATARVALCSSLVSCGPKAEPPAPAAAVPPPAAAPTERTEESCKPLVEAAFDAEGNRIPAAAADDEVKACCQVLALARDARDPAEPWPDRDACCSLLDWQGSATCTPWGPPVPPAFA